MRLSDIIKESQLELDLNEGLMATMSSFFFIDQKNDKINKKKEKVAVEKKPEPKAAIPFDGVCKYKNSVLIPDHIKNNEKALVTAAARIFRGAWLEKAEVKDCARSVLKQLIKLYVSKIDEKEIDMDLLAVALAEGRLHMSPSNPEYKTVQKIFTRLMVHRNSLIDELTSTGTSNFRNRWIEAREHFEKVIKNVIEMGGETQMHMGRLTAKRKDNERKQS